MANLHHRPNVSNTRGISARTEKLIAASALAPIRLNREEIKNSPAVHAEISDSMRLAEMMAAKMKN